MKYKILMLIPYIGELPAAYFAIFLASCKYNAQVDFLILNDRADAANKRWKLPTNVRIEQLSLADFNARASAALGCVVNVLSGYKLCDLRPMYGRIFAAEVADYQFWGHCDMDLVLGDLSAILTNDLLHNFDIISLRREWISGPFSLYRNADYCNNLYLKSKDWQRIATNGDYFRFDETGVIKSSRAMPYPLLAAGKNILDLELEAESITALLARLATDKDSNIRVYQQTHIKESLSKTMILRYDKGALTVFANGNSQHPIGCSFAHYHYITEKNNRYFGFPNWAEVPSTFYIDYTGFFTQQEMDNDYNSLRRRRLLRGNLRYYLQTFPRKVWKKLFK
jgi:hypothetical protein